MRCAVFLLAALFLLGAGRHAEARAIGVRDVAFAAAERGAVLHATVWYPAGRGGEAALIGDNGAFFGSPAFRNAPILPGRFPLVLIAHGGFRAAPNTGTWLAAALAAKGYIAAVIPPPPADAAPTPAVLGELWLRPADLSAALTAIARARVFAGAIDQGRIGAAGFFLGGEAVLALAGARLDPAAYGRSCDAPAHGLDCAWFARGHVDLRHVDAARLARSNRDPRVKAVIAIDPELSDSWARSSLKTIAVPVAFVDLGRAGRLAGDIPGARYTDIPDATPFGAFPECKPKGPAILRQEGGEIFLCEDGGRARGRLHARLVATIDADLRAAFAK